MSKKIDFMWDDNPVDITAEANFIWSIADNARNVYMPDKYGDVIIPMTILRRIECVLEETKDNVINEFEKDATTPDKMLKRVAGFPFYNTSRFTLKELCNDPNLIADNFVSYINGFSENVRKIFKELDMEAQIKKMDEGNCLFKIVKAFSELDLSIETFDSIKMGYIFENLMGRFYANVDAGQFYTGRDIIKLMTAILLSENCDDIFDENKVITILDQTCGTGGMLTTSYSYIKHINPTANVRLFGQEYMGVSHAMGLAEMLIKGQNAENFLRADTFKTDCFPETKMRFVIMNPPFGTPWGGKSAKDGQEIAVNEEYLKGEKGRFPAGVPGTGDGQMLFLQSAIQKLDETCGRCAIITNGSPLFNGGTSSGESQIRRWMLENDFIEAIIALPTNMFYNTGIQTYVWILSKNKSSKRKGKVQLINASEIATKLRKPLGEKKKEFLPENRKQIVELYVNFEENEYCQIYNNTEFLYKEYSVMQPLQRSYSITTESIERMLQSGALNGIYDEAKIYEIENKTEKITGKEQSQLDKFYTNKPLYDSIINTLNTSIEDKKYLSLDSFVPVLNKVLKDFNIDNKMLLKIADGLSVMDKKAEIQRETKGKNKGEIIYDKTTKDVEIVKWDEDIEDYMEREVLPYIPDAKWFWEEDMTKKNPVIRVGAEILFNRYFYQYKQPTASEELEARFVTLENSVSERIKKLFG